MKKILIFGDSISWGAFDDEKGGWVERLKTRYLDTFSEGKRIGVYNLSVSSNNTAGVLETIESDIEKFNKIEPEEYTLIFSIGSNDPVYVDTKDNVGVPFDSYRSNLEKIVEISKKYSNDIVFTGLMIVDEEKTKPWSENEYWENEDMKRYNDEIENICKKYDLDFIPLWDVLTKEDLSDGLHPNAKGHEKIYRRVENFLSEKLSL
ncbi:MAG: hypothetical protein HGB08_01895 [Candidatus Moranbacteria bacterium]|nr:hypothetical protein [Candidatus Moranbacteria bacterium]